MSGRPVGLLLAGGRASRLGGGDKPLRHADGVTLLEHLLSRLVSQCGVLVLSAGGDPARFAPVWHGATVPDHPDDAGCGPLAGLLAGLDWAATHAPEATTLLSVPADTPFVPADLATRLCGERPPGGVAFACSGGREHPLVALWPVARRDLLRHTLRVAGTRRARDALHAFPAVGVPWAAEPFDPFFNVNTPADLDRAAGIASQLVAGGAMRHTVSTPSRSTDRSR